MRKTHIVRWNEKPRKGEPAKRSLDNTEYDYSILTDFGTANALFEALADSSYVQSVAMRKKD